MEYLKYKLGQLSEPEERAYEQNALKKQAESQCNTCEEYKDYLLRYSPSVRFMQEQIQRVGGNINSTNIVCGQCTDMKSGGFHPELGILMCANKLYSRSHAEDTLTHELVHAYDHCRFDVDWKDLRHHACSEIRASMLSGECRMMNEFLKHGKIQFGRGHQACVRRRATLSVMGNPNCPDKKTAETVVDQIFDHCFNDTRPFEEIYR